jgi:hypothetical protein
MAVRVKYLLKSYEVLWTLLAWCYIFKSCATSVHTLCPHARLNMGNLWI